MSTAITYVDLFSGAGGFAVGLLQAGFTFKNHYYSETDPYATANYQYHFPQAKPLGPIEKVSPRAVREKIDLLTFGFPCQDLSSAGKRQGLKKGNRSRLFYEALRLIESWQPRVFIFENVKGLFSADKGRAFEKILQEIARLGLYECQWQLLDTAWFLPQHRERIYFVATLGKEPVPEVFPLPQSGQRHPKGHEKRPQAPLAPAISTRVGAGAHWSPYILENQWYVVRGARNARAKRIRRKNAVKGIDSCPYSEKEYAMTSMDMAATITTQPGKDNLLSGYFQYDPSGKGYQSQDSRIYHVNGHAPSLRSTGDAKILDHMRMRKLTPKECERLQGFPDDWTKYGMEGRKRIEISDSRQYKLMGNAVSVPVVKAVGSRLVNHLKKKARHANPL